MPCFARGREEALVNVILASQTHPALRTCAAESVQVVDTDPAVLTGIGGALIHIYVTQTAAVPRITLTTVAVHVVMARSVVTARDVQTFTVVNVDFTD